MLSSSQFYDLFAQDYTSYCNTSGINNFIEKEVSLVESFKPTSVLEFGIGTGRFAKEYIKRNPDTHYVGVDTSKEMLKLAKESSAILINADFTEYLRFLISQGKHFDCIIAPYTAFHHIDITEQEELIILMRLVAPCSIINCLTVEGESLFEDSASKAISYITQSRKMITTRIYKLSEHIRKESIRIPESKQREYLIIKGDGIKP